MRKRKYSKNVGVLLTEATYEKLVGVTDKIEIPLSEYIRKLVEDEVSQKEEVKNE